MTRQQSQGGVSAMESNSGYERAAEDAKVRMRQGYDSMTECVASNPASSMLVTFGLGFGVGVLIGYALSEPSAPPSRWYDLQTAEKVGRRVLDSLASTLPHSLSSRIAS